MKNRDVNEGTERPATRPNSPETAARAPLADGDALEPTLASPALHAWLDGEISDASAAIAERPQVIRMWKALGADAEKLRRRTTPPSLEAVVMKAIAAQPQG